MLGERLVPPVAHDEPMGGYGCRFRGPGLVGSDPVVWQGLTALSPAGIARAATFSLDGIVMAAPFTWTLMITWTDL